MRPRPPIWLSPLFLIGAALVGCPHYSDPNDPDLIGRWEANDRGCLVGKGQDAFSRLDFLDPHRVRLGNGVVVEYLIAEAGELVIKHDDYEGYIYEKEGGVLRFKLFGDDPKKERECAYHLLRADKSQ